MSSTWYVEKIVLPGGTWLLGVPSNPNGLQQAPAGSVAQSVDGTGPWKNTTGAMIWVNLSAGSGGETLAQTLVLGNVTGGTDLVVSPGNVIELPSGTKIYGVPLDPNGVTAAPAGSLALAANGTGPWKNTTGAMVWVDVAASGDSFVPTLPADWAPSPTTKSGALNQITRNGAGHFQKDRDPLLTPAPTIYVRTTGNDGNANDGSLLLPFASVARALQVLPTMPEYGGTYPVIDVGVGTFPLPTKMNLGGDLTISPAPMIMSVAYLIHASQPANTKATSTRLVLDTLVLAATVPVGTRVKLTATTVPGTPQYGIVCRSDNSGVGGRLVLWVATDNFAAPYVCDVAVGTSIEILAFATTFECQDSTTITGGFFYNTADFTGAEFTSAGGGSAALVIFDGVEADYSNFSITAYAGSAEAFMALPYFIVQLRVPQYASAELLGGVCSDVALFVRNYGGVVRCIGEMAAIGSAILFGASDGGFIEADGTVLRAFAGVGEFLSANDPSGTGGAAGLGGFFILGDCLEPRDLAGAVIAGSFTGTRLVNVGTQTAVQVRIGAASNITVAGVLNPVTIAGAAKSADVSGTRIVGGIPAPGAAGPNIRRVSAVGPTLINAATDSTLVSDTALNVVGWTLPPVADVTDGCPFDIANETGTFDVTVIPSGADTINLVAGAFSLASLGAGKISITLKAVRANNNWILV